MGKTVLRSIAVSAIGLAVSTAWAAELGSLTVYSSVGEPLRAQLTVKDVNASLSPRVRLAPASIYTRVGKSAVVPVSEMSLKLEGKDPYTLSIVSKNAVHEKSFALIVELSQGNDRSAKLYNIVLKDRPIEQVADAQTKPQTKEVNQTVTVPSVQKTASVPSVQKGVVPSTSDTMQRTVVTPPSVAHETATMVDRSKSESKSVPPVQEPKYVAPMPKSDPVPAMTAAQKPTTKPAAPVSEDLYPDSVDTTKPFTVKPGMTMWSIAKLFKGDYPSATMDQLLVAFVRDNPKNFEHGRVNGVRVGSTLRAPKVATVKRINVDEAWALVRVNPNADARKAPSKRDLTRAHQRMQKSAPALYKQVQVRLAQEKQAAYEHQAQKREAELKAQQAKKTEEDKPASSAQQNAPDHDPLAATIEATSRSESSATQQPKAEPQQTLNVTAETAAKVAATETAPEAPAPQKNSETIVKAEPEKESGLSTTLIALIVGLVAAIAAAVIWLTNRNRQRRQRDEQALKTVRFMKAEPTTNDQLKAAESMVENRLQADRAAARGFNLDSESPLQKDGSSEPNPVSEQATRTTADSLSGAQSQQATSGFNVASAYVAEETAGSSASASITGAAKKLADARNYIGVGGYDQALRACQEVLVTGSAQECEQARELIAKIENLKAGL